MKLKDRLSFNSTVIFGVVFALAATVVYVGFVASAERILNESQESMALLTALYYLEEDELPSAEHQQIRQQFKTEIRRSEARIYNEYDSIRYGTSEPDPNITAEKLKQVRSSGKLNFSFDGYYYTGLFYEDNQGDFVVFIKDDHRLFYEQRRRMMVIIVIVFLAGISGIAVLSRYISKLAYRPVRRVIKRVNELDPSNVTDALPVPGTRDEIDELVESYNRLLTEISNNMEVQKNFIDFVSHEFRTPLTAISGNIDVYSKHERTPEENRELVENIKQSVYDLEEILNTLIAITRAKNISASITSARLDEVLWDTVEDIALQFSGAVIDIDLQIAATHSPLLNIQADRNQLKMALFNLIKNAIKYSDNAPVKVVLRSEKNVIKLDIIDRGIGIAPEEIEKVSRAFYRGRNVGDRSGSGIGLTIARIIFNQNKIGFDIHSDVSNGTTITLTFHESKE